MGMLYTWSLQVKLAIMHMQSEHSRAHLDPDSKAGEPHAQSSHHNIETSVRPQQSDADDKEGRSRHLSQAVGVAV